MLTGHALGAAPGADAHARPRAADGPKAQVDPLPHLQDWQLYLVDWGYNTPAERAAATQHPRIQLINLDQFHALAEQQ